MPKLHRAFAICLVWAQLFSASVAEKLVVEFAPKHPATAKGNLVVIVSPQRFQATGPGLLDVYIRGQIHCRESLTLEPGARVEIEVGDHAGPLYAGAYLDEDRDFMGTALAEPGEYFASSIAVLKGKDQTLRLDAVRKPRAGKLPAWLKDHAMVSQRMLDAGFSHEQATTRFLVGLPPGYWQSSRTYPVLYVSHGFSGNRKTYLERYAIWRQEMGARPMILVSLDSNGPYGHHVFLNSEANGPRQDVLTQDIVPWVDAHFRGNGQRVVYGQSSGGWTAISLLRHAPDVFAGAASTGPDPLVLRDWWMSANQNMYQNPDGSDRMFAPTASLTMRRLVECEIQSRSFGQFSAFLAAFSPYRQGQSPLPFASPFDLTTGALNAEIWDLWEENDQTLWARENPDQAREAFSNRLALFVGDKDEFGLTDTTLSFSRTLDELEIPHKLQVIPGAGHTDYLDNPGFQRRLWTSCHHLAASR